MDAPDFNPFPTGARVDVWWTGYKEWYTALVTDTRIELHKIKGALVPGHEIYCHYEVDDHEQWHSLHNNKIRETTGVPIQPRGDIFVTPTSRNHYIAPLKGTNAHLSTP